MAFVAELGLDRAAFEEVSQFAVECHKKSFSCTVRRSIALLDCFFFGHVLALIWFCHSSATLASNTFRSWYLPRLGWFYRQPPARRATSAQEWADLGQRTF